MHIRKDMQKSSSMHTDTYPLILTESNADCIPNEKHNDFNANDSLNCILFTYSFYAIKNNFSKPYLFLTFSPSSFYSV